MACCIISFTLLTDLGSTVYGLDSRVQTQVSPFEPAFEVDPAGPGRTKLASPQARESCHHDSRHCPRVRGAAQCQAHHGECHINVYGPKQILSPEGRLCRDCLFVDAINALPCCLFHRCFVFRRWYRGCNVNRIAIATSWIALGIFVFSRCGGYEKAVDFFLVPTTALSSRRLNFIPRYFTAPEACVKV